jgi:hypothetical protein
LARAAWDVAKVFVEETVGTLDRVREEIVGTSRTKRLDTQVSRCFTVALQFTGYFCSTVACTGTGQLLLGGRFVQTF